MTCKVKNFNKMVSAQSSIIFNPQELSFVKTEQFGISNLNANSFGYSQAPSGILTFSWTDPSLNGVTLPDGSVLFAMRFKILPGNEGKTSVVYFDNTPIISEFSDVSLVAFTTYGLVPGNVQIAPDAVIAGKIKTELFQGVRSATITATPANISKTTNLSGDYWIPVPYGSAATFTPSKNNDTIRTNGITTQDALLIQRHILGMLPLSSPYQIIAADVNNSSAVTTLDIASVNAMIIGNITSFPGNRLWAFVPASHNFSNPQNPFPFPSSKSYTSASYQTGEDFIGMRLGDVNNSYNPNIAKQMFVDSVRFYTENKNVLPASVVSLSVKVKHFQNISGLQFTLKWDPSVLSFKTASAGVISCNIGQSQATQGELYLNWIEPNGSSISLNDGDTLININFDVIGNIGTSSLFAIVSSNTTPIEVSDNNLNILDVKTSNGLIKVSSSAGINSLLAEDIKVTLYPNPFTNIAKIRFEAVKSKKLSIKIFDSVGKKVEERNIELMQGTQEIEIGKAIASGNYLIQIVDQKGNKIGMYKLNKLL